jgi:hypothetical protein
VAQTLGWIAEAETALLRLLQGYRPPEFHFPKIWFETSDFSRKRFQRLKLL